ncbi:MAG TPA: acylphosphatase [Bacteroidetes bacterium]|mgnify:CR=1 FL=1|nr:acylphosphatase [Bacteroidota bacterium]HRK05559.1 acylphosphatase [Chlorobiota bacterium]
MPTVHYIIAGTVQGVGFRRFVMLNAQRLGLRGFVANLEDGTVECVAQGDMDTISELEMLLRQGPHHSDVTSITCTDVDNSRTYTQFRII